jgi:hypothetical protein
MLVFKASEFGSSVRDFLAFVGEATVDSRLARTDEKLSEFKALSDVLRRRYAFSVALLGMLKSLRAGIAVDFSEHNIRRAAGIICAINFAAKQLSENARRRFREDIVNYIKPNGDFRFIEHELRAFVHFRQQGYSVLWADLEGIGQFDFLVSSPNGQIEVECKTLSEDLGSPVHTEYAIEFFESFNKLMLSDKVPEDTGVIQLELKSDATISRDKIDQYFLDYTSRGLGELYENDDLRICFNRRTEWRELVERRDIPALNLAARAEQQVRDGQGSLMLRRSTALFLLVVGRKESTLLPSVFRVVKKASGQLSGHRPGRIWLHFLGLSQAEFTLLAQEARDEGSGPFPRIAHYAFRSSGRAHVSNLWLSADGEVSRKVVVADGSTEIVMDGPVYAATSNVCRFPDEL